MFFNLEDASALNDRAASFIGLRRRFPFFFKEGKSPYFTEVLVSGSASFPPLSTLDLSPWNFVALSSSLP